LGILEPPADADIVLVSWHPSHFAELRRSLRGIIATREKFVRQMPGRLVAGPWIRTATAPSAWTLSTAPSQHIRREKATSPFAPTRR